MANTHTHNHFTALWILSGTTWVSWYQKKHSPTHTYRGINRPLSASSIYCDPSHSPCLIHVPPVFFQFFFGLPLDLDPSISYSIHFFTQSLSSFRSTCPYHRNLFCCSTVIMSSNPSLSLNTLLGILSCSFNPHIHLTILISARWSATSFSFLMGQISFPCYVLLCTQLLYNLTLSFNDITIGSHWYQLPELFSPIRILFSTAASASPSTLNMSPK